MRRPFDWGTVLTAYCVLDEHDKCDDPRQCDCSCHKDGLNSETGENDG